MNAWQSFLELESKKEYFQQIQKTLRQERETYQVFPSEKDVFHAFDLCPLEQTKVLILGQDPYHNDGEAHGLSFSVQNGVKVPPSLRNIFQELYSDLSILNTKGNLSSWAQQGVLLLNSCLTVRKNQPNSHKDIGWSTLTDQVILTLNDQKRPIVFILWGNFARDKKKLITNQHHLIIESTHPSPFSATYGFFGSKPFSRTNNFLIQHQESPINWQINES